MSKIEMPVPCDKCGIWVELNETRESPIESGKMICKQCYSEESQIKDIVREIKDIQYMIDNNKGDIKGWKANMKVLKNQLLQQGYDFEDF